LVRGGVRDSVPPSEIEIREYASLLPASVEALGRRIAGASDVDGGVEMKLLEIIWIAILLRRVRRLKEKGWYLWTVANFNWNSFEHPAKNHVWYVGVARYTGDVDKYGHKNKEEYRLDCDDPVDGLFKVLWRIIG